MVGVLLALCSDSNDAVRQRALAAVETSVSVVRDAVSVSELLSALTAAVAALSPTDASAASALRAVTATVSAVPSAAVGAERASRAAFLSAVFTLLQVPAIYTRTDELLQQNLPIPAALQQQHSTYLATAEAALRSVLALAPASSSLPSTLRQELLVALMTHSFNIPASFHARYPAAALSLLRAQWTSPGNVSLSLQLQRRLLPQSAAAPADDSAMLGVLYESALGPTLKRLRGRMGGKEGEWKADVSSAFAVFQCLAHLSPDRPTTAAEVGDRAYDIVPLLLPLLSDWLERSRAMGSVLLSHVLAIAPFGSLTAFAPLLQHTLEALMTDRDSASIHVVVPASIDLQLSTVSAFPLSSSAEHGARVDGRLKFFASFLSALTFLSLSSSAQAGLLQLYLAQLVRLLLFMHRDVLPSLAALLPVLWRLGTYWDEGVRERAWVCMGWLVEVAGAAMRRRSSQLMERLMEAELECERQEDLNARTVAFLTEDMRDAPFALETRERTAGWSRTRAQVCDFQQRLIRRWPARMKEWRHGGPDQEVQGTRELTKGT